MLIVQKFGGTSVGSLERIDEVAKRVIETVEKGHRVVVVVSAMSGETNKLIDYAHHFCETPDVRDMDVILSSGERITCGLLSVALNAKGHLAKALTGRQAGIFTDDNHTQARIKTIEPDTIEHWLQKEHIVVIAGFQGICKDNDSVTTLGRGGSDLTAVAVAGALKADLCEIYTDVDGIYTTDPRIEPKAKKIDRIFYDSMLELSGCGAKVLHTRSVELAKKLQIDLVTRSSFNYNEGTLITKEEKILEKPIVTGIALDTDQSRISIIGVEDRPGIAADIFTALADKNVNVDMIVQTVAHDGKTNIDLTIPTKELTLAKETLNSFDEYLYQLEFDSDIAKISLVGVGMKSHSGVASQAFRTLCQENINIMMISTSEIKISVIIDDKYSELAVRALHQVYSLHL